MVNTFVTLDIQITHYSHTNIKYMERWKARTGNRTYFKAIGKADWNMVSHIKRKVSFYPVTFFPTLPNVVPTFTE